MTCADVSNREDGSFDVTLNVSASKFEADGQGEETEVAIDALLDIAVLGEEDPETGVPEAIYIAKERIDQAESQFTVNVNRQPASDPEGQRHSRVKPAQSVRLLESD